MAIVRASDGLRARDNGEWARQKLAFLDEFVPPALKATERKRSRHYVDLFAGPGRNVARDGSGEFEGSPLRILSAHAPNNPLLTFTDAAFINYAQRDHAALTERVRRRLLEGESRIPAGRVETLQGDANLLVSQVMRRIHSKAYAFVFADIEAPRQWPWASVEALKRGGHESVDLYMLFPLDMAIQRLICYQRQHTERFAAILTRFFGTDEWRRLAERRLTNEQSPELRAGLEELYVRQLEQHWSHVGSVQVVKRRGEHYLYRMLFATDHEAGKKIAEWAKRQTSPPQLGLFGD